MMLECSVETNPDPFLWPWIWEHHRSWTNSEQRHRIHHWTIVLPWKVLKIKKIFSIYLKWYKNTTNHSYADTIQQKTSCSTANDYVFFYSHTTEAGPAAIRGLEGKGITISTFLPYIHLHIQRTTMKAIVFSMFCSLGWSLTLMGTKELWRPTPASPAVRVGIYVMFVLLCLHVSPVWRCRG